MWDVVRMFKVVFTIKPIIKTGVKQVRKELAPSPSSKLQQTMADVLEKLAIEGLNFTSEKLITHFFSGCLAVLVVLKEDIKDEEIREEIKNSFDKTIKELKKQKASKSTFTNSEWKKLKELDTKNLEIQLQPFKNGFVEFGKQFLALKQEVGYAKYEEIVRKISSANLDATATDTMTKQLLDPSQQVDSAGPSRRKRSSSTMSSSLYLQ